MRRTSYALNKILTAVARQHATRESLGDEEMAGQALSDEERAALKAGDITALYHLGANPSNDRQGTWAKEDRLVGKPLEAWLKNKPGARDTARKAQDLLIELGDILVEVGLLAP